MIPALMPTLAERREMQRAMEKAGRSLALSAADPFHEGWDAVWEAGCLLNRVAQDNPERERACHDRLMATLRRCA
jgi:hypothetical protein